MKSLTRNLARLSFPGLLAATLALIPARPCFADAAAEKLQAEIDQEEAQVQIRELDRRHDNIEAIGGGTADEDSRYDQQRQAAENKEVEARVEEREAEREQARSR